MYGSVRERQVIAVPTAILLFSDLVESAGFGLQGIRLTYKDGSCKLSLCCNYFRDQTFTASDAMVR